MPKPKLCDAVARKLKKPARPRVDPLEFFQWEGAFENYARKFVRANHWRVAHLWGGPDDALQQAALVFSKCRAKYAPEGVYEQKHMMALFKTALSCHWNKHARRDGNFRIGNDAEALARMPEWQEGREYNAGPLAVLLGSASAEARQVMGMIFQAPSEVLQLLLPADDEVPDMEGLDRRFRRWFKLPPGAKVASEIKSLLTS